MEATTDETAAIAIMKTSRRGAGEMCVREKRACFSRMALALSLPAAAAAGSCGAAATASGSGRLRGLSLSLVDESRPPRGGWAGLSVTHDTSHPSSPAAGDAMYRNLNTKKKEEKNT